MRVNTGILKGVRRKLAAVAGSAIGLTLLTGCHMDMWIQPKVKPLQQSDFFADGQASRPRVENTMDRTHFSTDSTRYTGFVGAKNVDEFPFTITREDMKRGQERFNIFCSPCHGALGNGNGMIAMRGFSLRRMPASYQTDKLRKAPVGHFYDVITHGFGTMYSYASRVEPDDRWRITAYIRALQRSQNATLTDLGPDVTPEQRKQIESFVKPAGAPVTAPTSPTSTPGSPASQPTTSTTIPVVPGSQPNAPTQPGGATAQPNKPPTNTMTPAPPSVGGGTSSGMGSGTSPSTGATPQAGGGRTNG